MTLLCLDPLMVFLTFQRSLLVFKIVLIVLKYISPQSTLSLSGEYMWMDAELVLHRYNRAVDGARPPLRLMMKNCNQLSVSQHEDTFS